MAYPNGQVPEHLLVREGNSWFFPGTFAKFKAFRADVQDRHGVTLYVTPPAYGAGNAYRSLSGQRSVRAALGIMASVPGRSSHGGLWTGQTTGAGGLPTWVTDLEAGALDIANWSAIGWDAFKAAAERAGFIVDVVVPQELWHIVDLDPWASSASGGGIETPDITTESEEDTDMRLFRINDSKSGRDGRHYAIAPEYIKQIKTAEAVKAFEDAFGVTERPISEWTLTRVLGVYGIPSGVLNGRGYVLDDLSGQGNHVSGGTWSRAQKVERLAYLAQKR